MIKIGRLSSTLEVAALVGIDPASEGLRRAASLGVAAIPTGIDGLLEMPGFDDISIVFDATSAGAHHRHDAVLRARGKRIIDLPTAALGPFCIPSVNGLAHLEAPKVNKIGRTHD